MATASHASTDANNSNTHTFTAPGRVSPLPGKPKLLAPLTDDREGSSADMSALGKAKADILL